MARLLSFGYFYSRQEEMRYDRDYPPNTLIGCKIPSLPSRSSRDSATGQSNICGAFHHLPVAITARFGDFTARENPTRFTLRF